MLFSCRGLFLLSVLPTSLLSLQWGLGGCITHEEDQAGWVGIAGMWTRAAHIPVAHHLPLSLSADFAFPSCWLPSLQWLQVKRSSLPCRTHGGTSGFSVSLLMLLAMPVLCYQASSSSSTSRERTTWRQVGSGASLPPPASLGALCSASLYPTQAVFPACIVRLELLTELCPTTVQLLF